MQFLQFILSRIPPLCAAKHELSDLTPTISLSPPARRFSSHLARTYEGALCLRCTRAMRLRVKVTNFPPFRGCKETRGETSFGTRCSAIEGRARSRFLRHAQWARCDTRAIIRVHRLDTFNCHVNLFVPLPIEGGRAFSRERALARSFAAAKNPALSTQTTHNGPFTTR